MDDFQIYHSTCDKFIEITYDTLKTDEDGGGEISIYCPFCNTEVRVL